MNEHRRHVAVFIFGLSGGGAQRRTLTLAHAFAARGHRVDLVVARSQGPLRRDVPSSVRLVELASRSLGLAFIRGIRRLQVGASISPLARYLRRERPDVLLAAASHVNLAAVWAHRLARVPTSLVLRASNHLSRASVNRKRPPRLLLPVFARWFYPWADAIIAVSGDVADDLVKVTRISPGRITTIYSPVVTPDLKEKANAPLDHPWFAPGSPPVLLGVGRLVSQKDFSTLLRAFARLRGVREARLMILGEGRKRASLEALARELGVAADVALPGFVPNPFPYMARASVFVLSSAWEGLPGALIEAMACGCPVASTDCPGGPAEILDNGAYGPLVPVGDDRAMARAILSVLDAPPDRGCLRARAAVFSVDRAAERYLAVLTGIGVGARAGRAGEQATHTGGKADTV